MVENQRIFRKKSRVLRKFFEIFEEETNRVFQRISTKTILNDKEKTKPRYFGRIGARGR